MADNDELAKALNALAVAAKNPEGARNVLAMLFPKADASLETYVPNDEADDSSRTRDRRISKSEFAPTYFRLDPKPISWSRNELEEILELGPEKGLSKVEERVRGLSREANAHLRALFLDFLTASMSERRLFNSEWFFHLMQVSPAYIRHRQVGQEAFFLDDGFLPLNRLLFRALNELAPETRHQVVSERLSAISDLSVVSDFFRSTIGDINADGAKARQPSFFGERTDDLRTQLLQLIRKLAASGAIWEQLSPSRLLWFWYGSNCIEEVRNFLSRQMENPVAVKKLLELVIGTVVSTSGNYERVGRGYEKLIDLDDLAKAGAILLGMESTAENNALVNRYREALARGRGESF